MSMKPVPLVCVETGDHYPSISSAAKAVGVPISSIYYAARSGGMCAGHHWRRLCPIREHVNGTFARRRIIAELKGRMGPDGRATATIVEISRGAGLSEAQVRRYLHALIKAGDIARSPRFDANGGQIGNAYLIRDEASAGKDHEG